jgi:hypothetical protein
MDYGDYQHDPKIEMIVDTAEQYCQALAYKDYIGLDNDQLIYL